MEQHEDEELPVPDSGDGDDEEDDEAEEDFCSVLQPSPLPGPGPGPGPMPVSGEEPVRCLWPFAGAEPGLPEAARPPPLAGAVSSAGEFRYSG